MSGRQWTEREIRLLRDLYPEVLAETVAREIGRPVRSIYQKAMALGLRKSEDFNARDLSGRIQRGKQSERMVQTQFKAGLQPWNKGVRGSTGTQDGCRATQFKPGRPASEARNYAPIGTLRLSKDGCLERKVTDSSEVDPKRRWVAEHRRVWELENGPVPVGCAVVFKPGKKTANADAIRASDLDCLTRAELMNRNSVHTKYPPELARLAQLRGALNRQINAQSRALENT